MILTRKKDADLIILSNLDDKSLFRFCISSSKDEYLKKLCSDESFWRNRLGKNFPEFKNTSEKRNWKQTYLALVYYLNVYGIYKALEKVAKKGDKDLVDFFIQKGAWNWNWGMFGAAEGGHRDLVEFFIEKGANEWNEGMKYAAIGGQKDLIDFFIQKGANDWNMGLYGAAESGNKDLIEFFIQKGADWWNWGMYGAAKGGHKDLVYFFTQLGADNWNVAIIFAEERGHKELADFIKNIRLYDFYLKNETLEK